MDGIQDVRIKNDVNSTMLVTKSDGETPIELTGRNLSLFLTNEEHAYQFEITDFTVEAGGKILFNYLGIYQRYLGEYIVTLYENKGQPGQIVVDTKGFNLVPRSWLIKGEADPGLEITTVDIHMTVASNITGVSSVNGKTGNVVLSSSDVGAYLKAEADAKFAEKTEIPDVPEWAMKPQKPTYTKAEVGLDKVDNTPDTEKPVSTAQLAAINARLEKSVYNQDKAAQATKDSQQDTAIGNKVEKVTGKGLSTEDFTTTFKEKLEGLENYDDTAIQEALQTLTNNFNTLVSGDPTAAIESFNEIIAFLANVEDTETLEGIIAALNTTISQKVAQTDYDADKQTQLEKDAAQDTEIGKRVKISDYNTDKEGFALKTELSPVSEKANNNESAISSINEKDGQQDGRLTTLETASTTHGTALETQAESITALLRKADEHGLSIEALSDLIDNAGHHKALSYDAEDEYRVCGHRTVLYGAGVPSDETIPDQHGIPAFVGQLYINTSADTGGLYYAVGTGSVSSWKKA